MARVKRSLIAGSVGAALIGVAWAAPAQEASNSVIGPPQLKDFRLAPRDPVLTPPPAPQPERAAPTPPPRSAPAPRAETQPDRPPAQPARQAEARAPAAAPSPAVGRPAPVALVPSAQPAPDAAVPAASAPPVALPPADPVAQAAAPAAEEEEGGSLWLFALPAAALAFLGAALVRRRRRNGVEAAASPPALPAAAAPPPKAPRPDPVPRPWLELALKAERAAFTATEAEILFELEIANKGGSPARNLRVDVKIFNAGAEQDKEIGAFFRSAGRESTKLNLPGVETGVTGVLQGRVAIPVDEMKALRMDERLLFIPVVAVNVLYDWGEGRIGQTSRSYLVGRELQNPGEKMGAFRVDQGPRVWRTVAQREHKLAKRV